MNAVETHTPTAASFRIYPLSEAGLCHSVLMVTPTRGYCASERLGATRCIGLDGSTETVLELKTNHVTS